MRILVAGDTHGDKAALDLLQKTAQQVDQVLYTGDFYRDAALIRADVNAVCGNTDGAGCQEQERVLDWLGIRILLTHGHRYKVKTGLDMLAARCAEKRIQLAVFGHTHIPEAVMKQQTVFVNPGSASLPRGGYPASYAILDIVKRERLELTVTHRQLSGGEIAGLRQNFILTI